MPKLKLVIEQVAAALGEWEACAGDAGVSADNPSKIAQALEVQVTVSGEA